MLTLQLGAEVRACGLRGEVVSFQSLMTQTLYRLRRLHGAFKVQAVEIVSPFSLVAPTFRSASAGLKASATSQIRTPPAPSEIG